MKGRTERGPPKANASQGNKPKPNREPCCMKNLHMTLIRFISRVRVCSSTHVHNYEYDFPLLRLLPVLKGLNSSSEAKDQGGPEFNCQRSDQDSDEFLVSLSVL